MVAHLSTIVSDPGAAACAAFTICWRLPTRIVRNVALRIIGRDPGTSLWLAMSTSLFSSALAFNEQLVLVRPRWMHHSDGVPYPATKEAAREAGFEGFLYVNDKVKEQIRSDKEVTGADIVWIHAHGGGFKAGEARQYHNTYKRWIHKALVEHDMDLRIIAVEYPLSTEKAYPGGLLAMYSAYQYCLNEGVSNRKIVIVGDSAGGNLAISATFHILENLPDKLPAATLSFSGWLDLAQEHTAFSPHSATDWLTMMDSQSTKENVIDLYRGKLIKSPKDPRVSPLRRETLKGLPPQYVSAGRAEVLYMDSKLWAEKCKKELGSDIVETHFPVGEVHTFQIGGWLTSNRMAEESDRNILSFIKRHTK